jgi:ribonucleoside-triphosphate reductase
MSTSDIDSLFSHQLTIRKRDGRTEPFKSGKIATAIQHAGEATGEFGGVEARLLTLRVVSTLQALREDGKPLTVEFVQDVVEETLITSPYRRTAKAYIIYRDQHARIREMVSRADLDLIDAYLDKLDWRIKENSNMAYSLQGLNNHISSEVSKIYWLNKIYPAEIREAHDNGALHLHDLGLLSVYCVGWDLQDLLLVGFRGASGKAESRPAKHFRAALGQIVNFFYTLQGEAAGAQAFSNFDTLLAPFIRYDKLSETEVRQALQEFVFNLNVATRVGFQTPFTNLTMDLIAPASLANQPVVIGGKPQKDRYGDFQAEMSLLNTAFLEVMSEGDAKGRVFTFPIPTYNITPEFNWDAPGLDRLWEVTAKYGIPYFANFVNSSMQADDARSMCCRLRLDKRELIKRGGGLFGANPQTGSIGVVTLNLPRVGHLAKDADDFIARVDQLMLLARNSLETKRKVLEQLTTRKLYPYTHFYLRNVHERHGCYWKNHFSTIGLTGMNEACLNFLGKDIGTPEGQALAARVLDHMRDRLADFQNETDNLYNLEATPAEGTSFRLAKLDRSLYPALQTAGTPEAPFYTNSTQLPVGYSSDIFQVLDLQDGLQTKYTGGTVQHIFLGEAVSDPRAVKAFVRTICSHYRLPYFTLTPTFSVCPEHGYLRGRQPACPTCNHETEIYSRVVGYLRPVSQWNEGKQEEFRERSTFQVSEPTTCHCEKV